MTKKPSANCTIPKQNFKGILGFLPILDSLTHIRENIEPKTMIKNGLKNCVILAGISQPNIIRSTFLSANKVSDVPACSKHAQNEMLMIIKIMRAIIRSFHIPTPVDSSSLIPDLINDTDIKINNPSKM